MKSVAQVAVAVLSIGLAFAAVPGLQAADWPAWRYDAGRTAASPHGLPIDLQLMWMAEYPAPHRAWMEPLNQQRMPFDQCYEPIVVGKTLFFGSSREDCLVALDTDSGQERWRFPVDGPVRLPTVAWRGVAKSYSPATMASCTASRRIPVVCCGDFVAVRLIANSWATSG